MDLRSYTHTRPEIEVKLFSSRPILPIKLVFNYRPCREARELNKFVFHLNFADIFSLFFCCCRIESARVTQYNPKSYFLRCDTIFAACELIEI